MGYHKRYTLKTISQEKKKRDYSHFHRELRMLDISDIDTKRSLADLLRKDGFMNAGKTAQAQQNILNEAWKYLGKTEKIKKIPIKRPKPKLKKIVVELPKPKLRKNEVFITPKGFRKYQIRDKKTGRIKRWVDPFKLAKIPRKKRKNVRKK